MSVFDTAPAKAGPTASVGIAGEAYDPALAEMVNGLYKTELIFARPACPSATEVGLETMNLGPLAEHRPSPGSPGLSEPDRSGSQLSYAP